MMLPIVSNRVGGGIGGGVGGVVDIGNSPPETGRNLDSRSFEDESSLPSGNLLLDRMAKTNIEVTESKRKEILSSNVLDMLMNDLDVSKQPSIKKLNRSPKNRGEEKVSGSQSQTKRRPKLLFKSLSTENIFTSKTHGKHEVELDGSSSFSLDDDFIECAKPRRALLKSLSNPRIIHPQQGVGVEGIGNLGTRYGGGSSSNNNDNNVGNSRFTEHNFDLKGSSFSDSSLGRSFAPSRHERRVPKWSKKKFSTFMATAAATPSRVSHKIKGVATTAASSILDPMKRVQGEIGSTPSTMAACSLKKSSSTGEIRHAANLSAGEDTTTWATLRSGSANELKDYLRKGRKDDHVQATSKSSLQLNNNQNSVWDTTRMLFATPRGSTASQHRSISEIRQDSTGLVNDYLKRFGGEQKQKQDIRYYPESPVPSSSSEEDEENPAPPSSSLQFYAQLQIPLTGDDETEAEVRYSSEEVPPNELRISKQRDDLRRSNDSNMGALVLDGKQQRQQHDTQADQASSSCLVSVDDERGVSFHTRPRRSRPGRDGMNSSGHRSKSKGDGRSSASSSPRRHRGIIELSRTRGDDFNSSGHHEVRRRRRSKDAVPVSVDESDTSIVKVPSAEGSSLESQCMAKGEDSLKSPSHASRTRSRDGRRKKTSSSPKRNGSLSNNLNEPTKGEHGTKSESVPTPDNLPKEPSGSEHIKEDDASISLWHTKTSRSRSRDRKKRSGGSRCPNLDNSSNNIPAAQDSDSKYNETNQKNSSWHSRSRSRSKENRGGREGSRSRSFSSWHSGSRSRSKERRGGRTGSRPRSFSSLNSAHSTRPDNATSNEDSLNASWHAKSRRRKSSRDRRGLRREHRSPTRVVRSSRSRSSEKLSQKSTETDSRFLQQQQGTTEEEILPVKLHDNDGETNKLQSLRNRRRLYPLEQSKSLRGLFQQNDSSSPTTCDSITVRLSNSFVF